MKSTNAKKGEAGRAKAGSAAESKAGGDGGGSNSLERMLSLLDLFTSSVPSLPSEALIGALGTSRSTGYRYIKALSDIGILAPVANGHYVLGPRIIELDLQIRNCDPLYNATGPLLAGLVERTSYSAICCSLYSGSVLCIREERGSNGPAKLFSRGQRRPLFKGAASKIILAHLEPHKLRNIFAKHAQTISLSGLGGDWTAFRENMASIRRAGYVTSIGEFNPGVFGMAAPIFNHAGQILGSIGVAAEVANVNRSELAQTIEWVQEAGRHASERISVIFAGTDRAARAVG